MSPIYQALNRCPKFSGQIHIYSVEDTERFLDLFTSFVTLLITFSKLSIVVIT